MRVSVFWELLSFWNTWLPFRLFFSQEQNSRNIFLFLNFPNERAVLVKHWGPFHTYPDIFESATFSFPIRLSSTLIRRIRKQIRSPEWRFLNPITFRIPVLLGLISSLLACMQLNVALLNAEISYARRRLDICKLFTLSTAQNRRQKQLRRAGKECRPRRFWVRPGRTSSWWDNLVNPQWIRSESEYVWTGEFDLNTLWSHNVWTRIFSYPERKSWGSKNIRIRVDGAWVRRRLIKQGLAKAKCLLLLFCVRPVGKRVTVRRAHTENGNVKGFFMPFFLIIPFAYQ